MTRATDGNSRSGRDGTLIINFDHLPSRRRSGNVCAMSVRTSPTVQLSHSECRRIRLAVNRSRLESLLEFALAARSDVLTVVPRGLTRMPLYQQLMHQGLVHASAGRADGTHIIVLAATTRVWRKRSLKRGLLAIKRQAGRLGQRVVLASESRLQRAIAARPPGSPESDGSRLARHQRRHLYIADIRPQSWGER
jgi:hypothetical protein